MKPLTNESYYTILEKCTIEAFECLDLKELYPDNGAKAVWDVSGFYTQSDRLINEIIKESYIKENMRTTFLMALDRHWKQFEKKHEITRDYFYKKCFQALLLKTSQDTSWNKPDFGFDINAEPCKLNFIWNMRFDIEASSIKHQTVNPDEVKPKKLKKTLFEFIHNIENKEAFSQELKKTFPTEIGKSIKAVIDVLTTEKILIYGTKEFKPLFEELQKYFHRDIGTYNSVQNVKTVDKETTETINKKLNPLIIKYKTI